MAPRLVQGLVVKQLQVGADQVFGNVEEAVVVQEPAVEDAALAHLHDLQHLFVRGGGRLPLGAGEVAHPRGLAGLGEKAVVLLPQLAHFPFLEQGADHHEPFPVKLVELGLRQRLEA